MPSGAQPHYQRRASRRGRLPDHWPVITIVNISRRPIDATNSPSALSCRTAPASPGRSSPASASPSATSGRSRNAKQWVDAERAFHVAAAFSFSDRDGIRRAEIGADFLAQVQGGAGRPRSPRGHGHWPPPALGGNAASMRSSTHNTVACSSQGRTLPWSPKRDPLTASARPRSPRPITEHPTRRVNSHALLQVRRYPPMSVIDATSATVNN